MQKITTKTFLFLGSLICFFVFPYAASAASLNLVANPGAEMGDFSGWSLGDGFDSGWGIVGSGYAHSGNLGFISSYGLDTMSQEIDLVARGYSTSALDGSPVINLNAFTTGHWPNPSDTYRVLVELRDDNHSVIASYDTGTQTEAGDNVWTEISHTFTGYGSGLRYIYIQEEGHDAEFWAGQYGTVFDDTSITIGGAGPSISITAPGNGQTISTWAPTVDWGASTFCQYSYDGSTYTTVNCANNGSDISETHTTLSPTLYVLGIDAEGNSTVTSSSFFTQATGNGLLFGLVGYWKFDEISSGTCTGGKDSCDSSGNGNDGTYSGAVAPLATTPSLFFSDSHSLGFNGTDTYVTVNRPVSDDMTVCAWIKTATAGNGTNHWESAPVFDAEVPGLANDFGFGVDSNGYIEYGNGGGYDATVNGTTIITDDTWHHVCATRAKIIGQIKLYVDGAIDGTGSGSMATLSTSATARIGYGLDGTAPKYFNGLIDDLRVYQRVLSQSDISFLAQGYNSTDHTAPIITRVGDSSVEVTAGTTYIDAGATASDDVDGVITNSISVYNPVNTLVPGVYTITYDVSDSSGNAAIQVVRSVRVVAKTNTGHWSMIRALSVPTVPLSISKVVAQGDSASTKDILPAKTLFQGNTGKAVTLLQSILAKDPKVYPEGTVDGHFGPVTLKAVQRFQIKYNIANSKSRGFGIVGPRTRSKLNEFSRLLAGN